MSATTNPIVANPNGNVTATTNPLTGGIEVSSPNNAPAIIIRPYLPKGDGVQLLDGVLEITSAGLTAFSSVSGAFQSSDVGKICAYWQSAAGTNKGYGTIYSVSSPTSCVLQLAAANVAQRTSVCLVYGTDKGAEANSILAGDMKLHGGGMVSSGILCTSVPIVVPDGVILTGYGRLGGFDLPENLVLQRQAFALLAPDAGSYGALTLGDNTTGYAPRVEGVNIDTMLNSDFACYMRTSGAKFIESLAIRNRDGGNNGAALRMSNGSTTENSVCVAHNIGHALVVDQKSDVHIKGGAMFGSGASRYNIKLANCTNVEVLETHTWKSSSLALSGSQVMIESYGGSRSRSISLIGLTLDTTNGPHVQITVPDTCALYAFTMQGCKGFNNDSVPAATYPFMRVTGGASSGYIRGASIVGNVGDSSFATDSLGTYTAFIEGVTPSIMRAVSVVGNAINNCAAGYSGFTPNSSANNTFVPYGSGVTTAF